MQSTLEDDMCMLCGTVAQRHHKNNRTFTRPMMRRFGCKNICVHCARELVDMAYPHIADDDEGCRTTIDGNFMNFNGSTGQRFPNQGYQVVPKPFVIGE